MNYIFRGWNFPRFILVILGTLFLVMLNMGTEKVETFRSLIRITARVSLILFAMSFVASSLIYLWPQIDFNKWLMQNRRYVGVSFAISHLFHLIGIVGLAQVDPVQFWATTTWTTLIFGGLVYVFIVFMLITSFEKPSSWVTTKQWDLGHKMGSYGIWFIFMVSYFGRLVAMKWLNIIPAALILSTVILRYLAWKKKKTKLASN